MKLVSPLSIENIGEAYAAYCNMPVFKRDDRSPMSKRDFTKKHKAEAPTRNGGAVAAAKNGADTPVDVAQIVATVLAAMGVDSDEAPAAVAKFKSRTPRESIPADAARNAVLWALNTEGFLVLDTDGGNDPITQDSGTTLLSATFGPLS